MLKVFKQLKKVMRSVRRKQIARTNSQLNQTNITDALLKIGVSEGDTVMLHSSLSKLGLVTGGATTVIDAFIQALGNSGTLVMPAFPASGFNFDYLQSDPLFDIRQTPSKVGLISETFRKMHGVKRSFHPTDSVCALGPAADLIVSSHFSQITPYNSDSPFYKLCQLKAKIILLGVDLNSLTNLHTLEDAVDDFKFPVYHNKIFTCRMVDAQGNLVTMQSKCHDPAWSKQRRCNELLPHFKRAGFVTEGEVGPAKVVVIDAAVMHNWMIKMYHSKGITMYTPNGS